MPYLAPPGWYGESILSMPRWFDGYRWTDHLWKPGVGVMHARWPASVQARRGQSKSMVWVLVIIVAAAMLVWVIPALVLQDPAPLIGILLTPVMAAPLFGPAIVLYIVAARKSHSAADLYPSDGSAPRGHLPTPDPSTWRGAGPTPLPAAWVRRAAGSR